MAEFLVQDGSRVVQAIRRITGERTQWRVLVETWWDDESYRGRFVFEPAAYGAPAVTRESAALLHGDSPADVLSSALDVPEERLLRVLRASG